MSISLSKEKLIEIIGGASVPSSEKISFRGVEFDSREVRGGELFVALKGETSHGHQFVGQAFARGASLCLVESPDFASTFEDPSRLVVVRDTLEALWTLAAWWRRELNIPVIGVTGSVGKTTTKEMIASILLKHSTGTYSQKSFNNHVGVPYTICRIDRNHSWAVLEMGMNHPNELRSLTRIAEPNVAVITRIAPAHTHVFSSLEQVADAKFEIMEGLRPGGKAILNKEDPQLTAGLARADKDGRLTVRYFGRAGADVNVNSVASHGLGGISFVLEIDSQKLPVKMGIVGTHNALNAAAAALAARTLIPDLPLETIQKGLEAFTAPLMRLNIKEWGDRKIVDDSYNANPASMAALLDLAGELRREGATIGVVLGDMRELGEHADGYHRQVGKLVADVKPSFLVAVGPMSVAYVDAAKGAGIEAIHSETPEAAADVLKSKYFEVLLVKASRGIGLDRTVKHLLEFPAPDRKVQGRGGTPSEPSGPSAAAWKPADPKRS